MSGVKESESGHNEDDFSHSFEFDFEFAWRRCGRDEHDKVIPKCKHDETLESNIISR